MAIDVIVGLQRGDEGKGRFVDLAATDYDVIARGNGGANAGHTLCPEGMEPLSLHQIPSGIVHPDKINIIGNGVYLDPQKLQTELADVRSRDIAVSPQNLHISHLAHLVLPHHIMLDTLRENGAGAQGSTKAGIAFVAADKMLRHGVRLENADAPDELREVVLEGLAKLPGNEAGQLFDRWQMAKMADEFVDATVALKPFMADTVGELNDHLKAGKRVLAEGAQAFWLDINHGMYPAVTSSATTVSGLLDGLGVAPKHLGKVTGVAKAVKSHVGGGPFVTEIHDEVLAASIRGKFGAPDAEFGKTTERPRRIGYPDIVELRNAVEVNGVDELVISKLDRVRSYGETVMVAVRYLHQGRSVSRAPSSERQLQKSQPVYVTLPTWPELNGVTDYSQTPPEMQQFVEIFESELEVPVTKVGVGYERNQVLSR